MNPKSAIAKGKELEYFLLDKLLAIFPDSKRQRGSGSGLGKGDLIFDEWTIEAKNQKSAHLKDWIRQSEAETMNYRKWAIIWHPPQIPLESSVAILSLEDYLSLLKFKKDHQGQEQILDKYKIKNHLEQLSFHAKAIIKNL